MVLEFTPVTFDPAEPDTDTISTTTTYYPADSGTDYRWKARRDVAFERGDWFTAGVVCILLISTVEPNINHAIRTSSFGKFFNQVKVSTSQVESQTQKPVSQQQTPGNSKYAFPVSGKVLYSSPFLPCTNPNNCRNGRPHKGIDLAGAMGQPLLAAVDGVIEIQKTGCPQNGNIQSNCGLGLGNWFILRAKDGTEFVYGHNSRIHARNGQNVKRGEVIAEMGNSGRSTGVHLHLEIHKNGQALDPAKYFDLPPLWGGTGITNPGL